MTGHHRAAHGFDDAQAVAGYAKRPPQFVPGFADMQRMAMLLLAERSPPDARVLVLGAGGGLELDLFARDQAGWQFDGIDPSRAMLQLAQSRLEPYGARVRLVEGYIDAAPPGPFDAACSLLTLHFIAREERRRTLEQVRARLRKGAPFVCAHFSYEQQSPDRARWLSRYVAFAVSLGIARSEAEQAGAAIDARLPILSPVDDENVLQEAGFGDIETFYVGFGFRGWVAIA